MSEATVFVDYMGVRFTITYRSDKLTDQQRARFATLVLEAEAQTGDLRATLAEMEFSAEIVEAVVVRWNVTDATDQDVAITREAMKKLRPEFPLLVVLTILRHETSQGWRPTLSA